VEIVGILVWFLILEGMVLIFLRGFNCFAIKGKGGNQCGNCLTASIATSHPCDPAIPPLGTDPREMNTILYKALSLAFRPTVLIV
jgi:hypothetical protein